MNILSKFGEAVNVATYQHICDNVEDLQKIPMDQINLGSRAYIIATGELYIANSDKEWRVV